MSSSQDLCQIDINRYNKTFNNYTTELDLSLQYPKVVFTQNNIITSVGVTTTGVTTTGVGAGSGASTYIDIYCELPSTELNRLVNLTSPNLRILKLNNINFSKYVPASISINDDLRSLIKFEIVPPTISQKKPSVNTSIPIDVLNKMLEKMPNITEVNLTNNIINKQLFIEKFVNLEILKLNYTNITDVNLNSILNKTIKLKALYLNNNNLNQYSAEQFNFPALDSLVFMTLYGVDTETSSSIELDALYTILNKTRNIQYLHLGYNKFNRKPILVLNLLEKLYKLYLNDTNITQDELIKFLNKTPNLYILSLSGNNFKNYTNLSIPSLPKLTELYLDRIEINNVNMIGELLSNTPNITKLQLNENTFTVANINNIGIYTSQLKNLNTLEINIKSPTRLLIDAIIEKIIKPNLNITSIFLPVVKDYDYGQLAFRKYKQVLLYSYNLNAQNEIIKYDNGEIIYNIADITDRINNLIDTSGNTIKIILIVVMLIVIMGALFMGYKLFMKFRNN